MNIANINSISKINPLGLEKLGKSEGVTKNNNATFENLLQSAVQMVKETDQLTNLAEEEEIAYAMGLKDNTHDLQVAQQKANLSLQYTVAVRNNVLDAYKEIMNMQF